MRHHSLEIPSWFCSRMRSSSSVGLVAGRLQRADSDLPAGGGLTSLSRNKNHSYGSANREPAFGFSSMSDMIHDGCRTWTSVRPLLCFSELCFLVIVVPPSFLFPWQLTPVSSIKHFCDTLKQTLTTVPCLSLKRCYCHLDELHPVVTPQSKEGGGGNIQTEGKTREITIWSVNEQ